MNKTGLKALIVILAVGVVAGARGDGARPAGATPSPTGGGVFGGLALVYCRSYREGLSTLPRQAAVLIIRDADGGYRLVSRAWRGGSSPFTKNPPQFFEDTASGYVDGINATLAIGGGSGTGTLRVKDNGDGTGTAALTDDRTGEALDTFSCKPAENAAAEIGHYFGSAR